MDDIKDLQSEIWKRTFKNEGYDLHSDGTFTKSNNNKPSVSDSNPLTHALSDQFNKMTNFDNEDLNDNIKRAPSWDDENINTKNESLEASKPQSQININESEVNKKDEIIKIKTRKRKIRKSTGLTRNYDLNDPNIHLEKLYED
jgi:hypothetical protein